jgi:sugar O-acyltransferase (sialic acid O-acetyltransferase NeuD family)
MTERSKPLVILGGGGHARVVAHTAVAAGFSVLGYLAPEPGERAFAVYLGADDFLDHGSGPGEIDLVVGVGSTRPSRLRQQLFERFRAKGYAFAILVHPSAVVSSGVRLGAGSQILAGAVIQTDAAIGDNVIVNTGATIDHDCRIGAHTHIAPGATLCGDVVVGERVHVGAGAVVIQGIALADDVLVRAGTTVTQSIGGNCT